MEKVQDIWLAVVNPHAGSGKTISEWEKAGRLLGAKGIAYDCRKSGGLDNASMIACQAAKEGYRKFIAVGGDGTVHDVLSGVMNAVVECPETTIADFTLAVIPIGSGNDWIKAHNIPHDTESVVELIASGSFSWQDIVKVTVEDFSSAEGAIVTSYMINVGGAGFDARICERVNRQKSEGKSGKSLYVKSLLYNLFHYKPSPMVVECDGKVVFEGPCFSIALGLGKYSGGGMRQTPDAVLDDGLVDVTVIPPFSIPRILFEACKLFNGRILTVKELVSCKASRVRVMRPASAAPEPVEVDGEVIGTLSMSLEVLPHRIRVLHR